MTEQPYPNDPAFKAFKRIRNRIRMHYPEDIVKRCMADLNRRDATTPARMADVKPWELLLVIKWSAVYGEYLSPDRRPFTERDYRILRSHLYEMGDEIRMPDQYEALLLFLRNMANQQFWFQDHTMGINLARQSIFFRTLGNDSPLKVFFEDLNGITIEDFIHLSTVLLGCYALLPIPIVTEQTVAKFATQLKKGTVRTFLKMLSQNLQSLNVYLTNQSGKISKAHEYYEQTPLKRYPLLQVADEYYLYSYTVLSHGLQYYVFDVLREKDPQTFMDCFGPIFERYIENGLQYAKVNFLNERGLRNIIPKKSKSVDFYFINEGTQIFIEAKGVEIPQQGMITHLTAELRRRTENSIKKAIHQAHATWQIIRIKDTIDNIGEGRGQPFLIVVTYKDLYIGNGVDYMRDIEPDLFLALVKEYGIIGIIPPERIYFISINDFDRMVEASSRGVSFSTILHHAIVHDAEPSTKQFIFDGHINALLPDCGFPAYIQMEGKAIIDKIRKAT